MIMGRVRRSGSNALGVTEELRAALRSLARLHAVDRVATRAVALVREAVGADGAAFVIIEDGLCHYAEEDGQLPGWKGQRFPITGCMAGWSVRERRLLIVPDAEADARVPHDLYAAAGVEAFIIIPLNLHPRGAALGAYWGDPQDFPAETITALEAIARAAEGALSARRLGRR